MVENLTEKLRANNDLLKVFQAVLL